MYALDAPVVESNVVRRPLRAERLVPHRQLPDEVRKLAVVRVTTGFRSQDRHDLVGHKVPVGGEVPHRRIWKNEPRRVRRPAWGGVDRIEGVAEPVGGKDLQTPLRTKAAATCSWTAAPSPHFVADAGSRHALRERLTHLSPRRKK